LKPCFLPSHLSLNWSYRRTGKPEKAATSSTTSSPAHPLILAPVEVLQ